MALYGIIGKHMPTSFSRIQIGQKRFRAFCTKLFVDSNYQGKGYGKKLMEHWENDMKSQGYGMLLTSTQVDEEAQHFYRKLGYKDCGGFVIDVPGYEQPMEMFLVKGI
jgi:ribosomal protein S18 acetylase RimI-like enzyme